MNFLSKKRSDFYKDLSILITGSAFAQLIPFLLQPVLKRIFTPEDFGIFDIYFKLLSLLVVISTLSYELGIVQPKSNKRSLGLLLLSLSLSSLFCCVILVGFIFLHTPICIALKIPDGYVSYFYLLPFSVLFFAGFNAINYYIIRKRQFILFSRNAVIRRSIEGSVQIVFGIIGRSLGLFLGDLLGNMSYFALNLYKILSGFKIRRQLKRTYLIGIARKYSYLPKLNMVPYFLNTFSLSALSFLILHHFTVKEVGLLELTQKLLVIPTALIATSVSKIILQRVSDAKNRKLRIFPSLVQIFLFLLVISGSFLTVILLFADEIVDLLFEDIWLVSADYAKILVFYILFYFVISPLGQILIALERFKLNAAWQIGRFGLLLILFIFPFKQIVIFLIIFSAVQIVAYIAYLVIIVHSVLKYERSIK